MLRLLRLPAPYEADTARTAYAPQAFGLVLRHEWFVDPGTVRGNVFDR
ncbi:hypothetical protein [Mycobacterium ahvazicum]|nr:hypothetical protein [Mycobacterium ahvazicum]